MINPLLIGILVIISGLFQVFSWLQMNQKCAHTHTCWPFTAVVNTISTEYIFAKANYRFLRAPLVCYPCSLQKSCFYCSVSVVISCCVLLWFLTSVGISCRSVCLPRMSPLLHPFPSFTLAQSQLSVLFLLLLLYFTPLCFCVCVCVYCSKILLQLWGD